MKRLLLTSQGIPKELKKVFLKCLTKSPAKTSVMFVITAAYGEEDNPTWLNVYRNQLKNYGIEDIKDLDLRFINKKGLKKILENTDIVFVNGGNTFFLLKYARRSGFTILIKDFIKRGGLYIGVSAGSYIACPTIEQGLWKQKYKDRKTFGLKNLKSLHLVPFWIVAHFEEKWSADIVKASKITNYPIVALNDTQAVLVTGEKYKLVGKGKKIFFNGFKENL